MKKLSLMAVSLLMMCGCKTQTTADPNPQLNADNVKEVVAAMTLEEKALLVVGEGMRGMEALTGPVVGATEEIVPGAAGTTNAIPRLGIPSIVLADGPAGLRIRPIRKGDEHTYYCTGFPVATVLASTWNTTLVEQVGEAMGNEVKEYGVDVLLAPGMNLHRNPLCGRNFEYYSEDPYLTGNMAAAITSGVQSQGVGVSIKHFAVNNQETNRSWVDAVVTPRALRELYLKGFEIAVKKSQPWTIMSSYNSINGTQASHRRDLLRDITRDEWGFEGLVMTDWFGGKDAAAQMHAGNDLLMPGRNDQYERIVAAVKDGTLAMEDLDFCVENVLRLIVRTPRFAGYEYSNTPDLKGHAEVTRTSAAEGMVLLKNEGETLPLASVKTVALFGITSYDFIAGGTGSGDVNKAYVVDMREGMKNAGFTLEKSVDAYYTKYIAQEKAIIESKIDKSNPFAAFMPRPRVTDKAPNASTLKLAAKNAEVAVITLGRNSGEGSDRKIEADFDLTDGEKALVEKVTAAFRAAGKKTVVVLNVGGVIETASWKEVPDAILLAWQAGQEGGNTVADVLKGVVNPSGKLPMTFPVNYADHLSSKNFPWHYKPDPNNMWAQFMGNAANSEPKKDIDYTLYEEDVYVGYRYFDTFKQEVSYPFGYGLSYTTFAYANPQIRKKGNTYTLTVDVTNTGKMTGKEVVELYVEMPAIEEGRPMKELVAFAKTDALEPGVTASITMSFCTKQLGWFNAEKSAWMLEGGEYTACVGASSRDIRVKVPFVVKKDKVLETTHNAMVLQQELKVVKP